MTASIDAVTVLVFEAAEWPTAISATEIAQPEGSDLMFTKIENRAGRGDDVFRLLDLARLTS